MTRKRYTKLLMAKGWSRNSANAIAKSVREKGVSYQTAVDKAMYSVSDISGMLQNLTDMWNPLADVMLRFTNAVGAALGSFAETFNKKLYGG